MPHSPRSIFVSHSFELIVVIPRKFLWFELLSSLAKMSSYYRRSRYSSRSRSPYSYSRSRSGSRSRSRDGSVDAENHGNNLYVTGLSSRVTKRDLEKQFASEGDVVDVHLVVDPWTRESRGFGFVTMGSVADANRCLKYLDRSVLDGRVITVEKFLWQQAGCV